MERENAPSLEPRATASRSGMKRIQFGLNWPRAWTLDKRCVLLAGEGEDKQRVALAAVTSQWHCAQPSEDDNAGNFDKLTTLKGKKPGSSCGAS
jgi:hypothetical protein